MHAVLVRCVFLSSRVLDADVSCLVNPLHTSVASACAMDGTKASLGRSAVNVGLSGPWVEEMMRVNLDLLALVTSCAVAGLAWWQAVVGLQSPIPARAFAWLCHAGHVRRG